MWQVIIPAAMQLIGSIMGNKSANKAANAQIAGMQQGADAIKGFYGDAKDYMSPYMGLGQAGVSGLMGLLQDPNSIKDSEAYKWRFGQGMDALDKSAAARGSLFSGAHSKDAMQFGQGIASQELDNQWARMLGITDLGQRSAAGLGALGMGAGNSLANLYSGMGDARGSSYAQQGANNMGAMGGLASMFGSMFGGK